MTALKETVLARDGAGEFHLLVEGTEPPDWYGGNDAPAPKQDPAAPPKRLRKPSAPKPSPKVAEGVENAKAEGAEPELGAPASTE